MKPYFQTDRFTLFAGDCRIVLRDLSDCSVDSIVCDPPYELGFMGKGWDRSGIAYDVAVWSECLRVLKPGGHLLAFGGSRTYHRLACSIEDAGFEIRDQIQWIYGSGFPKSLDISKAIDAAAGAERTDLGPNIRLGDSREYTKNPTSEFFHPNKAETMGRVTAPSTNEAKQWNGWGTALKPAHEPIVLARKPLIGTVAENVLQHGTGGLNIDGCRIECAAGDIGDRVDDPAHPSSRPQNHFNDDGSFGKARNYIEPTGRWPANVIHDGSDEVLAMFPDAPGQQAPLIGTEASGAFSKWSDGLLTRHPFAPRNDSGSAARFFYCAKASQEDRNEGLGSESLSPPLFAEGTGLRNNGDGSPRNQIATSRNNHPTVKPISLMRYLCRLVTPPGGVVLDPFCGSGSTGKAAMLEGLRFIGIELSPEYCELAQRRIEAVTKQGLLFATA